MAKKLGLQYSLVPVSDIMEEQYCESAFQAALKLESLNYKEDHTVFLHDFTSVSRAPTVLMIYFAVMCRHPAWNNLEELLSSLKRMDENATPNMRIVKLVLENQKEYHNRCIKRWEEDEANARALKDNEKRQRSLTAAQEEAEILRLKRLAEAEAEKIRQQRAQFAEAERARL